MSLLEKVQAVVAEKLSVDEAEVLPEASFTAVSYTHLTLPTNREV